MKYLPIAFFALLSCSTVKQGEKGERGESAYEIWLRNGGKGSEADFLSWLKAPADKGQIVQKTLETTSMNSQKLNDIGYLPVTLLGCKADFSVDCGKILSDYIASLPINSSINLFIPAGKYYFGSTLMIQDRSVNIMGAGKGRTIIYVADGVSGIFINRKKGVMSDYTIERLSLIAQGKKKAGASGIKMWQKGIVRDVEIQGFSSNGIHIDGYLGGKDDNHDASFSKVYDCIIAVCGQDGILIDGKDGNACVTMNCDIRNNGGWGIRESSFLGGTHIGNMFHSNKSGSYTVDHPSAAVVIVGGYTEGDQPPSLLTKKTVITGATQHFAGTKYKD